MAKTVSKFVSLAPELYAKIEEYRRKQTAIPSFSKAVGDLLNVAFSALEGKSY